ncbi:MAG: ribosome silencing factor [Thermodesulfobacteriota bacterium]
MALTKQAEDLIIIDIGRLSSIADYLFVCSGTSDRQVQAVSRYILDELEKEGIRPLGTEGVDEGRWALLDYGDIVVHIFLDPVREYYDLEGLWADAPRVDLGELLEMEKGRGV